MLDVGPDLMELARTLGITDSELKDSLFLWKFVCQEANATHSVGLDGPIPLPEDVGALIQVTVPNADDLYFSAPVEVAKCKTFARTFAMNRVCSTIRLIGHHFGFDCLPQENFITMAIASAKVIEEVKVYYSTGGDLNASTSSGAASSAHEIEGVFLPFSFFLF